MTGSKSKTKYLAALLITLMVICVTGLMFGSVSVALKDIMSGENYAAVIVKDLRLPRVAGAVLSGMALSVAGLLLQCVTDNDLCSPNIIGVNAGAGFGVMLALSLFAAPGVVLSISAFAGAVTASSVVLLISNTSYGHQRRTRMILSGVAVGAMFNAGISFMSQKKPDVMISYTSFSVGGFNGLKMRELPLPFVIILICLVISYVMSSKLNLLCLGDDIAISLGADVKRLRIVSIATASAMCAASVSYAGLLGFVGLIVPHISRKIFGSDMKFLIPAAGVLGACLTVLSDLIGRTMFAPAEISAGVFLSAIGAPFFIFLLYRRRAK